MCLAFEITLLSFQQTYFKIQLIDIVNNYKISIYDTNIDQDTLTQYNKNSFYDSKLDKSLQATI